MWTSTVCRWSVTPNPVTNGRSSGSRTSSTSATRIGARSTSVSSVASTGVTSVLLVDRRPPLAVLRDLTAHDLEVATLERQRGIARLTGADDPAVHLGHRRDLHAGADEEDLVSREQLAAVDARLAHLQAHLAGQLEHDATRDADEDVITALGREHFVTGDQEDVARRRFREVTIAGEHQRLVEALAAGIVRRERSVDIGPDHLRARRDRVVIDALPGRDRQPQAAVDVEIIAHRHAVRRQVRAQPREGDLDRLFRLVDHRPHVAVLAEPVAAQQLEDHLAELVAVAAEVEVQDARGPDEPVDVLTECGDVELLVVGVPVRTDALEAAGAVVDYLRRNGDTRLLVWDDAGPEVGDPGAACVVGHPTSSSSCRLSSR